MHAFILMSKDKISKQACCFKIDLLLLIFWRWTKVIFTLGEKGLDFLKTCKISLDND